MLEYDVRIGRIRPRVPNIRRVLYDRESCATQEINEIKAAGAGPHPQGQGVVQDSPRRRAPKALGGAPSPARLTVRPAGIGGGRGMPDPRSRRIGDLTGGKRGTAGPPAADYREGTHRPIEADGQAAVCLAQRRWA